MWAQCRVQDPGASCGRTVAIPRPEGLKRGHGSRKQEKEETEGEDCFFLKEERKETCPCTPFSSASRASYGEEMSQA